jgi:hypothetical protein
MMCLWASYKKEKKIFFVASLKSMKKESDPDRLVRGADPGIRIRTKMSRIPNTEVFYLEQKIRFQLVSCFVPPIIEVVCIY